MKIGFDGKRAYQNQTGLGNYSRSLIDNLSREYPTNSYTLFAPKATTLFDTTALPQVQSIFPTTGLYQQFPAWWRRAGMVKDIAAAGIDVFHGLSNELPKGIRQTGAKSVVTVHDLIYERHPETYGFDERYVHRWKIKHACREADAVIAISQQTKQDLIDWYRVPQEKITVCYQSCNPIFQQQLSPQQKAGIRNRYQLPAEYFLFVSSITPRKNLGTVCEALVLLKDTCSIPLVVIGNGKAKKEAAKKIMATAGMSNQLIFLNDHPKAKESAFTSAADFPGIYQNATALVYPSTFEGFGLPPLEAMWSNVPVICSHTSSMPEVCGDAALYFSPMDAEALAAHLLSLTHEKSLANNLIKKGYHQARKFTPPLHAQQVMQVYQQLLH